MITILQEIPLLPSGTLSDRAQEEIAASILGNDYFKKKVNVQRRIASYVGATPRDKDKLILELLDLFWRIPQGNRIFSVFRDFDSIFGILGKRGHFVHQFEVFLLGLNFITEFLKVKPEHRGFFNYDSFERIFFTWLLTSTAHDLGYPLSVAKNFISKFADLYRKIHMKNLFHIYKSIEKEHGVDNEKDLTRLSIGRQGPFEIEAFLKEGIQTSLHINSFDAEKLQGVLKQKNNHGYISSLILCRTYLDYLVHSKAQVRNSWRIDALKKASTAIALHALPSELKSHISKISFNTNPFAFILILVDQLQEWSRSLRQNEKWPSYHLMKFSNQGNKICLSYSLESNIWSANNKRKVRDYIKKKKQIIKLMKGPNPSSDFDIMVDFITNDGQRIGNMTVHL